MLSLQKRKLFKILEISSIFVGVIMALYYFYPVFASPPSSAYARGETTDPTCSPGDTNCTVYPPLTTTLTSSTAIIMGTSSLRFAYNAANYAVLTVASDGALTVSTTGSATTTFANKISFLSNSYFSTIASGTWNGSAIGLAYGGTNSSTLAANGSIIYSDGTRYNASAVGVSGQILQSAGSGTPVWVTTTTMGFVNLQGATSGTLQTGNFNISGTGLVGTALGINSTSPIASLAVKGIGGTNLLEIASSTDASLLRILTNGNVGINSSSPIDTLAVQGGLQIVGGVTSTNLYVSGPAKLDGAFNFASATGTNLSITKLNPASDSGALTIGASAGTGLITIGNSNVAQTLSLGIGTSSTVNIATGPGTTTIAIGTGGAAGGIQIGATGVSTTIVGGFTVVGIGATSTNLNISGATNLAGTTVTDLIATNVTSTNVSSTNSYSNSYTGAWNGNLLSILVGGTNSSALAANGSIIYSDGTRYNASAVGVSGQILQSAGSGTPVWVTTTTMGFINLQGATAGTQQTGHFNISGTGLFGTSVGIGTTTPAAKLTIQGDGTANPFSIVTSTAAAGSLLTVLTNGNVGINSSSPIDTLAVQGGLQVVGGVTSTNFYVSGLVNFISSTTIRTSTIAGGF